jgi:protein-tyrosine-phosphatase
MQKRTTYRWVNQAPLGGCPACDRLTYDLISRQRSVGNDEAYLTRSQDILIPDGFGYLERYLHEFARVNPYLDRNVFIMMPFSGQPAESIFKTVAAELSHHGLVPVRADQRAFAPVLWWNIVTYMLGSSYGLVIYQPYEDITYNPNVSIEAGFMLAQDRPVLFLANESLSRLPTDFSGHIYKTYSSARRTPTVRAAVKDWIANDLSYYDYGDRKLILFLSLGGTCRCVMGKAILADLVDRHKIPGLAVDAAAVADPHHSTISPSAHRAITETHRERWIDKHRPRKLCAYLQDRANLIIMLTGGPLARSTASGSNVITDVQLFGESIPNPYPDNEDEESLTKYRAVRDQLDRLIESHFDDIVERAGARPG